VTKEDREKIEKEREREREEEMDKKEKEGDGADLFILFSELGMCDAITMKEHLKMWIGVLDKSTMCV
jgi:hypothetical protein